MPICVSRGLSSFHRKRAYINFFFFRDRVLNNRTRILSFIEGRGRFSLCLFLCILEHSAPVTLDYTHLLDESLTRTYSKSVKIVSHRLKVALIQFMAWMSDSVLFLCFINSIEMITFLNNKRQLKILNEIK